jgi:DNA invertase Pin-like site-specific DNA recombinase
MSGKIVGYIRVSSFDQNTDRQLESVRLDKRFIDKASGKDVNRPAFTELLNYVREDDLVIVHSMDRLARNLDDLRRIVQTLTAKKVKVQFIKENLVFTGEDSPMSQLLLSVMGAFAEFERSLIKERQKEGIEIAKKKGAYKGRAKSLTADQVVEVRNKVEQGIPKSLIARGMGVSRWTLYKCLEAEYLTSK